MNLLELFLGQIPEAVYFALFLIFTKKLENKRCLFMILMILEYILLKMAFVFNIWFQVSYTMMTYITLKILYKEKSQVTDIFTFGIASLTLIICSIISGGLFQLNPIIGIIASRVLPFGVIFMLKNRLHNIQKLYKHHWNRNDKIKTKIKSTTFRSLSLVIFNLMFYVINLGIIYALLIRE